MLLDTKNITGFDISAEPYVEICESGMFQLIFNFMPALNGKDNHSTLKIFNSFDKELEKFLSAKIFGEDRVRMLIQKPRRIQ